MEPEMQAGRPTRTVDEAARQEKHGHAEVGQAGPAGTKSSPLSPRRGGSPAESVAPLGSSSSHFLAPHRGSQKRGVFLSSAGRWSWAIRTPTPARGRGGEKLNLGWSSGLLHFQPRLEFRFPPTPTRAGWSSGYSNSLGLELTRTLKQARLGLGLIRTPTPPRSGHVNSNSNPDIVNILSSS